MIPHAMMVSWTYIRAVAIRKAAAPEGDVTGRHSPKLVLDPFMFLTPAEQQALRALWEVCCNLQSAWILTQADNSTRLATKGTL